MNKFKKFLLGTMLGLAVAAPTVGMVGCSKLGPDPNPPIEEPENPQEPETPQEDPQEETQGYTTEKLKTDFDNQLINLHENIFKKFTPEICEIVEELSDIDSKIIAAEIEINEIAEWQSEPKSIANDWEVDEEHQARLEELEQLIANLQEERAEVEDRLDEYYLEHGDDDFDDIREIMYSLEEVTGYHYDFARLKTFEINKAYIEDDINKMWGLFEIDANTLGLLQSDGVTKIEYKDGKLVKVSVYNEFIVGEGEVEVVDFEKQTIYFASIFNNQVEDSESFYSPFKAFNDGKLGFADLQELLEGNYGFSIGYMDFSKEEISSNYVEGEWTDPGVDGEGGVDEGNEGSEEEGSESNQVVEGKLSDLLDCLSTFQKANIKLPMSDIFDELYEAIPATQYPLNYFGGTFSYDEIDTDCDPVASSLQEFFNTIDAGGLGSHNELQVLRIPKFSFDRSVDVGEDELRPDASYSVYRQVGTKDILLPVELNQGFLYSMKVVEGLPTGEVQFEYFNGQLEAGNRRFSYSTIANLTEDYPERFSDWLHQMQNPADLYFDDDNDSTYGIGVNHFQTSDYEMAFAIMVDEDGHEELVLVPVCGAIQVE